LQDARLVSTASKILAKPDPRPERKEAMEKCNFSDFLVSLKGWLDTDYIRKVTLKGKDRATILFTDNVINEYTIAGCSGEDVASIISNLKRRGIPVEQIKSPESS
jgi:hypothetical protein